MTIFITLHKSQQHNHDTTSTMIQQVFQTILNTSHKQLITLLPNIYHKEIHEFHTLNKGLEIHLPQIIEQSLREPSLFVELPTQSNLVKQLTTIRFPKLTIHMLL